MRTPRTVKQSATVAEAAQVIIENRVSGIVVVDDAGNLVGMLSELDCMQAIVSTVYNGGTPGAEKVSEVMTKEVAVNRPGEDISTVASALLKHKHRRRPIVDNGKLVGQVSCRQLLRAINDFGAK
ncbi:MAG: protein-inosine monophosphate dehydrogenase [Gammaproteobacteria bacterium]|nr:MAG: protein-inosine monophosphate dehydrogenase [Gammaproteobacteria bacterium]